MTSFPQPSSALPAYLIGLASWFVPLGILQVLFPWLVAVVLRMDAFAVGVAQMAIMAPSLLFMPLGGLAADRGNLRRLLLRYHFLYALPPLVLALVLMGGGLSYPALIVYALAVGSIGAFAVPTRDALLPSIAAGNLPRAVALVTALQMAGQLLGIACASLADRYGAVPLLLTQAGLVLAGALAVWRLPALPPRPPAKYEGFWRSIADGGVEAAKSDQIWPVLLINVAVGIFYVGPFVAVLPIAVRDAYGGGALELAYVNFAFWAATIVAAMALVGLTRTFTLRGRLIFAAVSGGAVVLVMLATLPPFWLFVVLIFVWGLGAGVTLTQGRTVVQIMAPASHRARLMSLFQLGIAGGGPIGALTAGSICALWGVQAAMLLPACGMMLVLVAIFARSRLWSMRTVE